MELSQDQVLAQLKTRGFEEGFQRTPLRDFWGVLDSYGGDMREGQRGAFLVVLYNFKEVEVIESIEPYTSPIAQVEISHSSRAKSRMGYWGESVDKIINTGIDPEVPQEQVKNQDYLLGKRCHLKLTPGHMIFNVDAKEERPNDCWTLMEVAGEATSASVTATAAPAATPAPTAPVKTATQAALEALDGKTEQEWHQEVFTNSIVKANQSIVNAIIGRTFLPDLETAGVVTKGEDGIYHVKKD